MKYRYKKELLLFVCACVLVNSQEACPSGWFGSRCQYKCHCKLECYDGMCDGPCEDGWFGSHCQYQDLTLSLPEFQVGAQYSSLADDDEETCIHYNNMSIDLIKEYFITWMRISVLYPKNIIDFKINFQSSSNQTIKGVSKEIYVVKGNTIDIQVFLTERVQYIKLEGSNYPKLCSLRISGGRNIAIKQNASQSTTNHNISLSLASNAVDGNTNGNYSAGSCSHTGQGGVDRSPTWTLILQTSYVINRIVIYNRIQRNISVRLRYFRLMMLDERDQVIYCHNDTNNKAQIMYTVFPKAASLSKKIMIQATDSSADLILTLCEVELYAECPLGKWGLECNKLCKFCNGICRRDDGTCDEVCSGDSMECVQNSFTESDYEKSYVLGLVVAGEVVMSSCVVFVLVYLRLKRRTASLDKKCPNHVYARPQVPYFENNLYENFDSDNQHNETGRSSENNKYSHYQNRIFINTK